MLPTEPRLLISSDSTPPRVVRDLISFKDYVQKNKEGQKDIYYITGEKQASVANSPFIEALKKKRLEVLF